MDKNPKIRNYQSAFTLVEMVIATIILATAIGGLWASFIASKRFSIRSKTRLMAINNARYVLELLREDIRADTWASGDLSAGAHNVTPWLPQGPDTFRTKYSGTAQYTVTPVGNYKRVDIIMSWRTE